jgi:hypothetical protein
MRRGERSGDQRSDGAVSRVGLHFGGRTALSQGLQAGQDLTREGSVELLLGCVVNLHSNPVPDRDRSKLRRGAARLYSRAVGSWCGAGLACR